jgi:hypothetical protein
MHTIRHSTSPLITERALATADAFRPGTERPSVTYLTVTRRNIPQIEIEKSI